MTRNSQLHQVIVYCKNCIHRGKDNYPMFIEYWDKHWDEFIVVDHTQDEMFCSEGKENE